MYDINPEWVSAISAFLSMVAASSAACAAFISIKHQRRIERTRLLQVKNEVLLKNMQSMLLVFAGIQAANSEPWSNERSKKLQSLSKELRSYEIIISSLNKNIKNRMHNWATNEDAEGNSVLSVVQYILGNLHAITGNRYDAFFERKTEELIAIQETIFKDIAE